MTLLLDAQGICKAFGGVPALRDARLSLRAGEVHALIGQNGAGKSTLIKVLAGAHAPDAGEIRWQGQRVQLRDPLHAQQLGIATIHQEISLVPLRSLAENLFLGREPRGRFGRLDRARMEREASALMQRLGQDVDVRRPLGEFPIATQQLAAIARAIGSQARLVIMDEPTSSLDPREVQALFGVIRRLQAEGVTVVLISHRLDELFAVCDRITVMRDGQTVLEDQMAALTPLQLVATMLGRELGAQSGQTAFSQRHTPPSGPPLLRAEGLATGLRLREASLEIRPGELHGLGGLLGSGRSEFARALFGADPLQAGRIEMQGARWRDPRGAIAAGLALCAEDRKLDGIIPEASVRENLTLALLPRLTRWGVVDARQQAELVDRFIQQLGIKCASAEQPIRELSGGNQQKVLLARWLCMQPRLLILDEPTRGIDVGAKAEIQRLIDKLAREGLAVLMISSEPAELLEGCDRVSVMVDGQRRTLLEGDALCEPALLAAMAHAP